MSGHCKLAAGSLSVYKQMLVAYPFPYQRFEHFYFDISWRYCMMSIAKGDIIIYCFVMILKMMENYKMLTF